MAQDYASIRVTPDVKDKAEIAKEDGETWNEYVLRCTENPPTTKEFVEKGQSVTLDATERQKIAEEVAKILQ